MYDEDRARVLDQYREIFDEAGNDNAVLQLLVSPTRQAVNLARAYDAKQRRLQSDDGDEPAFMQVINELRQQADALMPAPVSIDNNQLSLFEEPDVAETVFNDLTQGDLPEPDEGTRPESLSFFPDEDRTDAPAPRTARASAKAAAQPELNKEDDYSDAVEAFLADFTIREEEPERRAEPELRMEEETLPRREPTPTVMEQHDEDLPPKTAAPAPYTSRRPDVRPILPDLPPRTEKKASVPLLILYILLAVPICAVFIAALLALAAACLGFAGAALAVGFEGLLTAFTAFSVFADILLVFGGSLILCAVGLLVFWLFVWLLFGAVPGVVRGACRLARKLCYKEVAV